MISRPARRAQHVPQRGDPAAQGAARSAKDPPRSGRDPPRSAEATGPRLARASYSTAARLSTPPSAHRRKGSAAAPGASRREARPRRRRARGSAAGRWARRSLRRCTGGGRPLWRRAMRASGASRVELPSRAAGERRAPLAPNKLPTPCVKTACSVSARFGVNKDLDARP